jgi:hypothetical protein
MNRAFGNQYSKTHGYTYHPLYQVWSDMKRRCYNQNMKQYKDYGGRGISVCRIWRNDSKSFIEWALSNGWKQGLVIDRINNDGNYTPGNCRFVTRKKSAQNRRQTNGPKAVLKVKINGKSLYLKDAVAKYSKIGYSTVYTRIYRHGWTPKQALEMRGN